MERTTYRVAGDDHAVEQRAHGVEAAHVQACRWGRNSGSGREKGKARESWNIKVGAAECSRVRRPRARTFSKTESRSEGKISIKGLHPVGPHRLPLLTLTSFYYYSGLPAMHCEKLRHRLKRVTLRPGGGLCVEEFCEFCEFSLHLRGVSLSVLRLPASNQPGLVDGRRGSLSWV